MRTIIDTAKRLLFKNIACLLLLELLYKAGFFMIMIPVCRIAFRVSLKLSGFSYLTLENIAAFLRNPVTVISLIVILALSGFFLLLEFITLTIYYDFCEKEKKLSLEQILFPSIRRMIQLLKQKRNIVLLVAALVSSMFILFPLLAALLTQMKIPNYIFVSALNNRIFKAFILTFLILASLISYHQLFLIPLMVLENNSFRNAWKKSGYLKKGKHKQIILILIVWNLILILLYLILYYTILFLAAVITYNVTKREIVYIAFIKVYEQISFWVSIFVAMIAIEGNICIITSLYNKYRDRTISNDCVMKILQQMEQIRQKEQEYYEKRRIPFRNRYRKILAISGIIMIGVNFGYIYDSVRNGSNLKKESLLGIAVTAHRGASADAPENTIPALEKAIERMADYAEIDVQETKDGVVVLLHDSSLERTTNVSKKVWDVTYLELLEYDAGSWFSKEYEKTKIPTLSQALELCKGKINLNIEIKARNKAQSLVEKVVRLIEQYDFEQQCVITSTSYSVLTRVKELNPQIKTGYILAIAYGNFYNSEYADFFSVKSSFINENMVRLSHHLGKEVHAWTVNTKTELERMKQLGVNNIITDKPLLAKEILYKETKVTFLGLFKQLLEMTEP